MPTARQKLDDLQAVFNTLIDSDISRRTLRPGVMAGLKVLSDAMNVAAPVSKKPRRQKVGGDIINPGRLSRSAGRSMRKDRTLNQVVGKAGLNVGKKKYGSGNVIARNYAPHAHLVTIGTGLRVRNKIGGKYGWMEADGRANRMKRRTGRVNPSMFVRRAAASAAAGAVSTAKAVTLSRLDSELQSSANAENIVAQINLVYSL